MDNRECLNSKDRTWYHFDDSTVRRSNIKPTDDFVEDTPYILFYARSSHLDMGDD